MPAPRGFTASSASVKDQADRALDEPDGITLTWLASQHGLDACKFKSRSFQCVFNALRARARRMKASHYGHSVDALDMETQGPYDRLACVRAPMPDNAGWIVSLRPAALLADDFTVTNAVTGEIIAGESPEDRRTSRILMDMQNNHGAVMPDDWAWLEIRIPGIQEECRAWFYERRPDLYAQRTTPVPTVDVLPEPDAMFSTDDVDRSIAPVPVKPPGIA